MLTLKPRITHLMCVDICIFPTRKTANLRSLALYCSNELLLWDEVVGTKISAILRWQRQLKWVGVCFGTMLMLASIEGRIARREVACPCEIAVRGLDTAIGLRTGNRFLPRLMADRFDFSCI
ncbi:hypothetical protein EUGRSUZ_E01825 [Eucalyptus grandis]|uniref:Uncharacterized protein n=2 Tax=Eucalyptus grandis TaxID=71139 RepID=A0A059C605_EUCGR|nr:hypothetical protein EUGRSUZ_E01825 [Eucalyptus grandis]